MAIGQLRHARQPEVVEDREAVCATAAPRASTRRRPARGLDAADAGHRDAAPRSAARAPHRRRDARRAEEQLVVVAAGQHAFALQRQRLRGQRARSRGSASTSTRGADAGAAQHMAEVAEQAVGDVDRAGGNAAQRHAERHARLRPLHRRAHAARSPSPRARAWPRKTSSARRASPSVPLTHRSSPARAPERSSAAPAGTSPNTVMQMVSGPRVVSPPTSSQPCASASANSPRAKPSRKARRRAAAPAPA